MADVNDASRPDGLRVVVVMPLYNEEVHVAATLRGLPACVTTIVLVDDGSVDHSVAAALALDEPRLVLVQHAERRGVGRALASGFAEALRQGADIVVTMDADGQMDPRDLGRLLAPLERGEAAYVKGCRFDSTVSLDLMPWSRRLANRLLSAWSAHVLDEPRLRDAHCGYTAAAREVVQAMDLDALHASYGVYTSILAQVLRMSWARLAFVPVAALYGTERSHVRVVDLAALGGLLLRLGAVRAGEVWRRSGTAGRKQQQA